MRNRSRRTMRLGVTGAVIAACLTVAATAGQQTSSTKPFPPYKAPRLADGRPDLNGLWQALVTANIDLEDHEAQPGPQKRSTPAGRRPHTVELDTNRTFAYLAKCDSSHCARRHPRAGFSFSDVA